MTSFVVDHDYIREEIQKALGKGLLNSGDIKAIYFLDGPGKTLFPSESIVTTNWLNIQNQLQDTGYGTIADSVRDGVDTLLNELVNRGAVKRSGGGNYEVCTNAPQRMFSLSVSIETLKALAKSADSAAVKHFKEVIGMLNAGDCVKLTDFDDGNAIKNFENVSDFWEHLASLGITL